MRKIFDQNNTEKPVDQYSGQPVQTMGKNKKKFIAAVASGIALAAGALVIAINAAISLNNKNSGTGETYNNMEDTETSADVENSENSDSRQIISDGIIETSNNSNRNTKFENANIIYDDLWGMDTQSIVNTFGDPDSNTVEEIIYDNILFGAYGSSVTFKFENDSLYSVVVSFEKSRYSDLKAHLERKYGSAYNASSYVSASWETPESNIELKMSGWYDGPSSITYNSLSKLSDNVKYNDTSSAVENSENSNNAADNSSIVSGIHTGMSQDEVFDVIGHDFISSFVPGSGAYGENCCGYNYAVDSIPALGCDMPAVMFFEFSEQDKLFNFGYHIGYDSEKYYYGETELVEEYDRIYDLLKSDYSVTWEDCLTDFYKEQGVIKANSGSLNGSNEELWFIAGTDMWSEGGSGINEITISCSNESLAPWYKLGV